MIWGYGSTSTFMLQEKKAVQVNKSVKTVCRFNFSLWTLVNKLHSTKAVMD
mgnify:CR=1 FL=1